MRIRLGEWNVRAQDERLPHEDYRLEAKVRSIINALLVSVTSQFNMQYPSLIFKITILNFFSFQYVHPGYNPANFRNDVALVRLQDEVVFKEHISPVCLPSYEQSFIHQYAKVIGWGRIQHGMYYFFNLP